MAGNDAFICGIGSTNIDILYGGLERLPNEGEELYSKTFSLQLGGGAPATMISLARLGIKTKIATQLSSDMFSSFAKSEFEKNGVSPLNLYHGSDMPLNITSAMITSRDRTFVSFGRQCLDSVDDAALESAYQMCKGAKIVTMQAGPFFEVYKKLKEEGTTVVFDCGWDDELCIEKYKKYLDLADYYTPNQKEALKITGAKTPLEAAKRLSCFFEKVTVKLDKDGCLGLEKEESYIVPPIKEFRCVDATGAGDAFMAGFLYGLFYEKDFRDCILYGNITGGKSVTAVGCLSAYCSREELEHYFKAYR